MSSFSKTISGLSREQSRGFTLIEMLVVVAIFTIMTGILLANLPEFRDRSSLELLAQQVAINVRTAQVYGIGTKASGQTGGEDSTQRFQVWYGVHFDNPGSGGLKSFLLFTDRNKNGRYDVDGEYGDEKELIYDITGARYAITKVCGVTTEDVPVCDRDSLDIVYRRPNTEAAFCTNNNGCVTADGDEAWDNFSRASITLGRIGGRESKVVSVWNNGQITVELGTIPNVN